MIFAFVFFALLLLMLNVVESMVFTVIETGAMVLLICLIRLLFRKHIRAGVMNVLWLLIAIRFFASTLFTEGIRFGISDKLGALNLTNSGADVLERWINPLQEQIREGEVLPIKTNLAAIHLPWWFWGLWIAGVVAVYVWSTCVNERFRRKLFNTRVGMEVPGCRYSIYKVTDLMSPCVMTVKGKKGIYLTERVAGDEKMLRYVLAHEISHLEHHDLFWAKIRCITLAFNWFNPLIWLAVVLSKRDSETACDERVLKNLSRESSLEYGRVLVDIVDDTNYRGDVFCMATTMTSSGKELKYRISQIADGRKKYGVSILVAVLTIVAAYTTSFYARADIRMLTPQETVQQYIYYWNQNYTKGMSELRLYKGEMKSRGILRILSCEEVKGEGDSNLEWGEEAYYAKCRLRLRLRQSGPSEYEEDVIAGKPVGEFYESWEEFLLAKESEGSDWKIYDSTLDRSRWY